MPRQNDRHLATIVGANIRAARDAADLTQRQLAERIGAEGVYISRWERGENSPSPKYLPLLADVLFAGDISALYREADPDPVAA
jgi:transcriptional regulator with XRE-family HTH domain